MALTFPSNPFDGDTFTDDLGHSWVFRLYDAVDTDLIEVGAWGRVLQDMSLVFRETSWITPVNNQQVTIPSNRDFSLFLTPTSSLARVDLIFPTLPKDGQTVFINLPYDNGSTIFVRLYWSGLNNGYSDNVFRTGESYAYQFIAGQGAWQSL